LDEKRQDSSPTSVQGRTGGTGQSWSRRLAWFRLGRARENEEKIKGIAKGCSPRRGWQGNGQILKRGGRRREFRGGRLGPSGDDALVAFRRQGGAANVRLSVATFTTSSVGSGGRPRRRTEAVADQCCPAAAGRREAAVRRRARARRSPGTRITRGGVGVRVVSDTDAEDGGR
jgi:hypothetical protein